MTTHPPLHSLKRRISYLHKPGSAAPAAAPQQKHPIKGQGYRLLRRSHGQTRLHRPRHPGTVRVTCHGQLRDAPRFARTYAAEEAPPRSQCLIVVNLLEAEDTTAQARLDHDLQLLRSHMVTLFDGDEVEPAASIRVKAVLGFGKPR
ncbi:unnamed protein product [Echinostoma caproni]|uniref:Band_3_cyto domain-containing protein n=1 Tax=Echinostoma caproni TaxID=27848 RepID=A0A183A8B2_9TREM|nr:unnamed protein product [Echinostoma caproni]